MKTLVFLFFILTSFMVEAEIKSEKKTWKEIPGFIESYLGAVKLNKSRFADVNNILIGDTILLPSKSGVVAMVADKPTKGRHDCIWLINQRYLVSQLIKEPLDTVKIQVEERVEPITTIKAAENSRWTISKILFYFFGLIVLCIVLYVLFLIIKSRLSLNYDDNPIIPEGLSADPLKALVQIKKAYPTYIFMKKALKVQHVLLKGPPGVSSVKVKMTFSDGARVTRLKTGEEATRVERETGLVNYYRQSSGNLFGILYQKDFELPAGWGWVLIREVDVPSDMFIKKTAQNLIADPEEFSEGIPKKIIMETLAIETELENISKNELLSVTDISKMLNTTNSFAVKLKKLKYMLPKTSSDELPAITVLPAHEITKILEATKKFEEKFEQFKEKILKFPPEKD